MANANNTASNTTAAAKAAPSKAAIAGMAKGGAAAKAAAAKATAPAAPKVHTRTAASMVPPAVAAQLAKAASVATARPADAAIGRRAIEAARFASGAGIRAGQRFVNIALYIGEAIAHGDSGKTVFIRYSAINNALGTKRGAGEGVTGKARQSIWRTGIVQARQYAPAEMAKAGAIAFDDNGLTVTIA